MVVFLGGFHGFQVFRHSSDCSAATTTDNNDEKEEEEEDDDNWYAV